MRQVYHDAVRFWVFGILGFILIGIMFRTVLWMRGAL